MRKLLVCMCLLGCAEKHNLGNTQQVFGPTRWAITLGGTGEDRGMTIAIDPAGDVIAAGDFQGTVDFGTGAVTAIQPYASWISKRSRVDGSALWTVTLGTGSQGRADIAQLAVTSDGGFVVTGTFSGIVDFGGTILEGPDLTSGFTAYVARYDANGGLVWASQLNNEATAMSRSVAVGHDGRVYVAGIFRGVLEADATLVAVEDHEAFVVAFDPDGRLQWGRAVRGRGLQTGESVAVTAEGDVLLSGALDHAATLGSAELQPTARVSQYVARFTTDAQLLWTRVLGVPGIVQHGGLIGLDANGGLIATSVTRHEGADSQDHPRIEALDPNGLPSWSHEAISGNAGSFALTVLADGSTVTAGGIQGFIDFEDASFDDCLYLAAHGPAGAFLDGVSYMSRTDRGCTSIPWSVADAPNALAFTGLVDGPPDFGTGTLRFAGGQHDAMIVMLDRLD